jgi:tRNA 2-selenouridine synthase
MTARLASLGSLVHPHQMEIQEFDFYSLVIDARSAQAYEEDHLPGAISIPIASEHGTALGAMPVALVARDAGPKLPYALAGHVGRLAAGDTVLVYCDRGGLDSLVWAEPLKAAGFRVDVLGGGWINFRRWVSAGLEVLPRTLTFRPLLAPPVGGLCRVLNRLTHTGEQVVDLTALAGQELVPGMTLVGDKPPSQSAFETALLIELRKLDPQRPVWTRLAWCGLGGLQLPPALRDALQYTSSLQLEVPLDVRAVAWSERLQALGTDMAALLQAISASTKPPAVAAIKQWQRLAEAGQMTDALTDIIKNYIDSRGAVSPMSAPGHVARLASLATEVVEMEVEQWRSAWARRGLNGATR